MSARLRKGLGIFATERLRQHICVALEPGICIDERHLTSMEESSDLTPARDPDQRQSGTERQRLLGKQCRAGASMGYPWMREARRYATPHQMFAREEVFGISSLATKQILTS